MTHSLRMAAGDTLIIAEDSTKSMFTVLRPQRQSYRLRTASGGEVTRSHEEIYDAYVDGRLEHFPANLSAMCETQAKLLQSSWDAFPAIHRFEARRREAYCMYVEQLASRGISLKLAAPRASITVSRKNEKRWYAELTSLVAVNENAHLRIVPTTEPKPPERLTKAPAAGTIGAWFRRWRSGGKDIRALLPWFDKRGNRLPRKIDRVKKPQNPSDPLTIYAAMQMVAEQVYLRQPAPPMSYAFKRLEEMSLRLGIACVCYQTFRRFIRANWTPYECDYARLGAKAANYKYNLFSRRPAPERPLQEVEVDHTLVDAFVKGPNGYVGKPWLTLLVCAATRAIIGLHLSFDVPCKATLQRALMHALCVKDLSAIKGLKNGWPCHGLPETLITDRGKEFCSANFKHAAARVGVRVINLPGRCPHLKAKVERFFGTLNMKVISGADGNSKARQVEVYCPETEASMSLSDLAEKIVRWIVDDYHVSHHYAIGAAPLSRWSELTELYGVRPVRSFGELHLALCPTIKRTIGNTGIRWDNRLYRSLELQDLRRRSADLGSSYTVRCDPYNRGNIWVLDVEKHTFICVPAVHQETAAGITEYQSRVISRMAREAVPDGSAITNADLAHFKAVADDQAKTSKSKRALRYLTEGALTTPLVGVTGFPTLLGAEVPTVSEAEIAGQGFDPELVQVNEAGRITLQDLIAARLQEVA